MQSLSVVTSCHGYGQYLGDWARSIVACTQPPGFAGIVTHGNDQDREYAVAALAILRSAGIPSQHDHHDTRLDFGDARNRAVALSSSEWVMHLDADDMLMPHAIAEIDGLAPLADVVSLGYERCGDLASGPNFRRKTYHTHQGQSTLDDTTPSSGVSPFRRSFWEQSPYRTDMRGGWDTALWIGFAHLRARFVPTKRPAFWYRQHGDSVFNVRRKGGWVADVTGRKLQGLRRQDDGVSILVPYDPTDPARVAGWEWLRARFTALYPTWQIVEGHAPGKGWNKGLAVADALTRATGSILVIADADCVHAAGALGEAVALVEAGTPWVVPHTLVHRLSSLDTDRWLESDPSRVDVTPTTDLARRPYKGFAGGGSVVVPRATYEACGGIPSGFNGWGGEDETLAIILDTLAGPHVRLDYDLVHLWHPPQERRRGGQYRDNRVLASRYGSASGDPVMMHALVTGGALAGQNPYSSASWRYRTHGARGTAFREDIVRHHKSGATFTMRNLESQQHANAARAAKQQERRESAANYKLSQQVRAAKRRGLKMDPTPIENKMIPSPQVAEVVEDKAEQVALQCDEQTEVVFASTVAAEIAAEAGLTDEAFAALEPGPNGFTATQVRSLL